MASRSRSARSRIPNGVVTSIVSIARLTSFHANRSGRCANRQHGVRGTKRARFRSLRSDHRTKRRNVRTQVVEEQGVVIGRPRQEALFESQRVLAGHCGKRSIRYMALMPVRVRRAHKSSPSQEPAATGPAKNHPGRSHTRPQSG
jgi:hypothetical protein